MDIFILKLDFGFDLRLSWYGKDVSVKWQRNKKRK